MRYPLILVLLANVMSANGYAISDITTSVLSGNLGDNLNIAAFGDFNSDKLVDIFVLDDDGKSVKLLIAKEKSTQSYDKHNLINKTGKVIKSVVPGDFDGDAQMDILVTRGKPGAVEVEIYWGADEKSVEKNTTKIKELFNDQPAVLDWNGDMIPDLLAENSNGTRKLYHANTSAAVGSEARRDIVTNKPFPKRSEGKWEPFRVPHSNSFVDINSDYNPDLVITTHENFEVWLNQEGVLEFNYTIPLPENTTDFKFGQSVWVDIDQDSEPDLLLPACQDKNCDLSHLYVYHNGTWTDLKRMFVGPEQETYGYVPGSDNPGKYLSLDIPVTLHMGDFNTDGYPDILVTLSKNGDTKGSSIAYLIMNEECDSVECERIGRTFNVLWSTPLSKEENAVQVTFFDIFEDGVFDILLVKKVEVKSGTNAVTLKAYKNTYSADASFVKITVVSGLCNNDCYKGRTPYGVNQPGVTVKYDTTKPNGAPTQGRATQLSQSAHFALQLPYTIFGLGQLPNFVDQMYVGIPRPPGTKETLVNSWPQIIPNTQLIVNPYPTDKPKYWQMKLYVKPSESIMITGAVLVGCLGVVACILGGLHWKERKEDQEEKKQEAQKFHFDAM